MHVIFSVNFAKEVETLKVALGGTYNPSPTAFGVEAKKAGIDFQSEAEVVAFVRQKVERENIPMQRLCQQFSSAWAPHEQTVTDVFLQTFETTWDPGEVTAYLTLAQRCPYSIRGNYYFVSATNNLLNPVAISLHELQHFYSHEVIEPRFRSAGIPDLFHEFKESLTVILNYQFTTLLETPDRGYAQHGTLRDWIASEFTAGKSVKNICDQFIARCT